MQIHNFALEFKENEFPLGISALTSRLAEICFLSSIGRDFSLFPSKIFLTLYTKPTGLPPLTCVAWMGHLFSNQHFFFPQDACFKLVFRVKNKTEQYAILSYSHSPLIQNWGSVFPCTFPYYYVSESKQFHWLQLLIWLMLCMCLGALLICGLRSCLLKCITKH